MEEEKKEPKPRGGKREGSGRKPKGGIGTILCSVKLRQDYVALIRENFDNLSGFVDQAVREKLRKERLI